MPVSIRCHSQYETSVVLLRRHLWHCFAKRIAQRPVDGAHKAGALAALLELAERAWSVAEVRRDVTKVVVSPFLRWSALSLSAGGSPCWSVQLLRAMRRCLQLVGSKSLGTKVRIACLRLCDERDEQLRLEAARTCAAATESSLFIASVVNELRQLVSKELMTEATTFSAAKEDMLLPALFPCTDLNIAAFYRRWSFLCTLLQSVLEAPIALELVVDEFIEMATIVFSLAPSCSSALSSRVLSSLNVYTSLPQLQLCLLPVLSALCVRLGRRLLPNVDALCRIFLNASLSPLLCASAVPVTSAFISALGGSVPPTFAEALCNTLLCETGDPALLHALLTHCGQLLSPPLQDGVSRFALSALPHCTDAVRRRALLGCIVQRLLSPGVSLALQRNALPLLRAAVHDVDADVAAVARTGLALCQSLASPALPLVLTARPETLLQQPQPVPVRVITEPVRDLTEPVRSLTEPVCDITEPVRDLTEPVCGITEPVRDITEPVRDLAEPVRDIAEPVREVPMALASPAELSAPAVVADDISEAVRSSPEAVDDFSTGEKVSLVPPPAIEPPMDDVQAVPPTVDGGVGGKRKHASISVSAPVQSEDADSEFVSLNVDAPAEDDAAPLWSF